MQIPCIRKDPFHPDKRRFLCERRTVCRATIRKLCKLRRPIYQQEVFLIKNNKKSPWRSCIPWITKPNLTRTTFSTKLLLNFCSCWFSNLMKWHDRTGHQLRFLFYYLLLQFLRKFCVNFKYMFGLTWRNLHLRILLTCNTWSLIIII